MADGKLIFDLLPVASRILDVGCGPVGSHWWPKIPASAEVWAIDANFRPKSLPSNVRYMKVDAQRLKQKAAVGGPFHQHFDLVVADHLFEHVRNPAEVAAGCALALKSGGKLHVGIPEATQFGDTFYRLLHWRDQGGHIAQFSRQSMIDLMEAEGLRTLAAEPWADDWVWLAEHYNPRRYLNFKSNREELRRLAAVLVKELTPEKGYLYGYEYVFQKP